MHSTHCRDRMDLVSVAIVHVGLFNSKRETDANGCGFD